MCILSQSCRLYERIVRQFALKIEKKDMIYYVS